jgi:hypothetical protein
VSLQELMAGVIGDENTGNNEDIRHDTCPVLCDYGLFRELLSGTRKK